MKKNIGRVDKSIRFVLGLMFMSANAFNWVSGTFGIILLVLGAYCLITASINFCPLYKTINFSSLTKNPK